jgi:hypothetical protein
VISAELCGVGGVGLKRERMSCARREFLCTYMAYGRNATEATSKNGAQNEVNKYTDR